MQKLYFCTVLNWEWKRASLSTERDVVKTAKPISHDTANGILSIPGPLQGRNKSSLPAAKATSINTKAVRRLFWHCCMSIKQ